MNAQHSLFVARLRDAKRYDPEVGAMRNYLKTRSDRRHRLVSKFLAWRDQKKK